MRKVIDGLACNTGHKTQSSYVQRLYNKYQENVPSIIFLKIYLLCTYLFYLFFPASGLSCSMRHLLLWRVGFSLVFLVNIAKCSTILLIFTENQLLVSFIFSIAFLFFIS